MLLSDLFTATFEVDYTSKLNHVSIFTFYITGISNSSYISFIYV